MNAQKTKTLIAYYDDGGYGLVGGYLNTGEDITYAAVRETQEETGLTIDAHQLEQFGFLMHKHGKVVLLFTYTLPEDVNATPKDDVTDLTWADISAIKNGEYSLGEYLEPILRYANT